MKKNSKGIAIIVDSDLPSEYENNPFCPNSQAVCKLSRLKKGYSQMIMGNYYLHLQIMMIGYSVGNVVLLLQ